MPVRPFPDRCSCYEPAELRSGDRFAHHRIAGACIRRRSGEHADGRRGLPRGVFWRPLAAGWAGVLFPLLVVATGESARRVLGEVCARRVALVGAYGLSAPAVGVAAIVVATVNPFAIIAWLGCLPAWAAIGHHRLHMEARRPRPRVPSVGWRDMLIALALGLGAGARLRCWPVSACYWSPSRAPQAAGRAMGRSASGWQCSSCLWLRP